MGPIIPSGSAGEQAISVPSWSRPIIWWGIEVGCLARVLPLGGPHWSGEIVLILSEEEPKRKQGPRFKVIGRKGTTILPYYALSIERYPKSEKE